jgi:hypothetical protein
MRHGHQLAALTRGCSSEKHGFSDEQFISEEFSMQWNGPSTPRRHPFLRAAFNSREGYTGRLGFHATPIHPEGKCRRLSKYGGS